MKAACLIIPAFEPDRTLIEIIDSVQEQRVNSRLSDLQIIVVNDGSINAQAISVFSRIKSEWPKIVLIELDKNAGKGQALKTGFRYIKEHMPKVEWIVTADADGQHLPKDICTLIDAGGEISTPALGVRSFDTEVPLRSHIGNSLTRQLFKMIHGGDIIDTQTGLRGFPRSEIDRLLEIKVKKYEFELEALIHLVKQGGLRQIPITTVYEPSNPTSHFRPLLDSMRIYWVLLRHIIFTGIAMLAEVIIFLMLSKFGLGVAVALTSARIIAGSALFWMSRLFVFRSEAALSFQAFNYIALVGINLMLTIWLVNWLNESFNSNLMLSLFIAYSLLFVVNFFIQRFVIFARRDDA